MKDGIPGEMKWRIQEFDPEFKWMAIDTADSLEDALELAKSLCSWLDDGNNVRILCPDGKII